MNCSHPNLDPLVTHTCPDCGQVFFWEYQTLPAIPDIDFDYNYFIKQYIQTTSWEVLDQYGIPEPKPKKYRSIDDPWEAE